MMFNTNKQRNIYEGSPFGAAVFNADVSVGLIATILGVSRQTIYGWFDKERRIGFLHGIKRAAMMKALDHLVSEKVLPCEMDRKEKRHLITSHYAKFHNLLLTASGEHGYADSE